MSSKVQTLIKFSQTIQGRKKISVISPFCRKWSWHLKEGATSLGKVPCLSLKYPFSKLPAYDVYVNKTLRLILSWGVMPFIVYNAVIAIMFFLALNCILKFYSSMCLERKIDRAHVITWSLVYIFQPWLERITFSALWMPWQGVKCSEETAVWVNAGCCPPSSGSGKRLLCWRCNCLNVKIVLIRQRWTVDMKLLAQLLSCDENYLAQLCDLHS